MRKPLAFLFFFFGLLNLLSCRSDKSKAELYSTTPLCDKKLFVETYMIFGGGAGGGDRVSEYLTDSVNFRMYIGTFVQGDYFYSYECSGDSIKVYKVIETRKDTANIIKSTKLYLASDLKREKKFD